MYGAAVHPAWVAYHIFDDRGRKQSLNNLLKGSTATTWRRSTTNELGRLSQGIKGRVDGTNAVKFIKKSQVPKGKTVTYVNMVCDYRPLKEEQFGVPNDYHILFISMHATYK